jgi:hypothetical protein
VFQRPVSLEETGLKECAFKNLWNWKVKYLIPPPTLCPDCRQQRRLSFRNEKTIVFRTCDLTWKKIFSMYSPDKKYKVYHYEDWFTDKWDAKSYWKDFDFSKSFFEQFHELDLVVPKMSLSNLNMENSDFVSQAWHCKNCYLIFNADMDENCYYWQNIFFSKYCIDSFWVWESEQCYNCIRCIQCYDVKNWMYSYNCRECNYVFSCIWCNNCSWCVSLNNSEFCIFNIKYSKEEYFKKLEELTKEDIENWYQNLLWKSPRNALIDVKNSENILWDLISWSKDIYNSFEVANSRDVRYSTNIVNSEDIFDVNYFWVWLSKAYEWSVVWYWSNLYFCFDCWNNVDNLTYCFFCVNWVKNCFWCVWLHSNEQYCILNKQYAKEEYEKLVPKIINHMKKTWEWWEFFPSSISPFWYNETVANEYFPMSRDFVIASNNEAIQKTWLSEKTRLLHISQWQHSETFIHWPIFNRSDYEAPFPKVDKIIPASKLPDNIKDIPDDILNRAIECEVTKKPFKIIAQELEFYRKHNLPIPRRHPDQRHLDRMALRNPRKLFDRKCDKCWVLIKTTYNPDRKEIVYCEEC